MYYVATYRVDPAWCEITYSYQISSAAANVVIDFDPATLQFKFKYSAKLDLSGPTSKGYIVSVKGISGSTVPMSATATFTLTLKNPCIDSAFVVINQVSLPVGE